MKNLFYLCFTSIITTSALIISGCATQIVEPAEFTGYLTDYSQLEATTAADGSETLRWASPEFTANNYTKAHFTRVVFHPKPTTTDQISDTTLSDLQTYADLKIKNQAKSVGILATEAGSKVVSIKTAITGVKSSPESLKPLEIIPFKLVMAGAGAAIGFRDQDITVYFEIIGEDSLSQKPLFKLVRKISGDKLSSKWDQMELKHIQETFDIFSEKGINALAKHLSQ